MKISWQKYVLDFKFEAGTSRGVLTTRNTWFVKIEKDGHFGIGEAAPLPNLSVDDLPGFDEVLVSKLKELKSCKIDTLEESILALDTIELEDFPSIRFCLETAFINFFKNNNSISEEGILINGLIWMGDEGFMKDQISEKIAQGFTCVKLKIGAIDFEKECALLDSIRNQFDESLITLRVDANGAFHPKEALDKLRRLAQFGLHSIEQPINAGLGNEMAKLCAQSPLPIALDEELIGVTSNEEKEELLLKIRPQYIIIKPSLVGGFKGTVEWVDIAEENNIGWWMTSALESNIGLNAIAQFTADAGLYTPQGLGTGQLFNNNIPSPINVTGERLFYDDKVRWDYQQLDQNWKSV